MHERTFVDVLRERAQGPRAANGYTFLRDGEHDEPRLGYAELDRRARSVAAVLQGHGARGERALLVCPSGLEFIAGLFGCFYAGAIAVPLPPPDPATPAPGLEHLRRVGRDAGARFVIAPASLLEQLGDWGRDGSGPAVHGIDVGRAAAGDASAWRAPDSDETTVALLQYTSGSTGDPRGVVLRHANLLANAESVRLAFAVSGDSRGVSWLPLHHDMGLMGGLLEPMLIGANTALMSPQAFLQRPVRWLAAISRLRATTCGGPNFAYDLLARRVPESAKEALDLSCWQVAFCGAEPVRLDTLDDFARAFGGCGFRRSAFLPCYGLAEATLLVTAAPAAEGPRSLDLDGGALEAGSVALAGGAPGQATSRFVGCGPPASGVEVRIVDPEALVDSPPARVGEIWVRGASVASSYWGNDEATRHALQARLADGQGRFLRTGDLGFLDRGELFVTGRLKDLILIRGRNLYPQDIEATLEDAHAAVRPGRTVAFGVERDGAEHLVVACELNRRAKESPQAIAEILSQAVAARHGVLPLEVLTLQPGDLPRTSSGKPRRPVCRALFLQGSLGSVRA